MNVEDITNFHYNRANKLPAIYKSAFKFASKFYDLATIVRNYLYDKYILPIACVDAKVISVGNLTTGGVGKTPFVAELANYYSEKFGDKVCIISRGYGGQLDNKNVNIIKLDGDIKCDAFYAGDEPFWLAQNTNETVMVLTCADRAKAAEFAVNQHQVTIIILDDGFQHRKLNRDTDIVLIDSENKFGNESVLPYGPLRENLMGLKRADLIYVVSKNVDHTKAEQYARILAKKLDKDVRVCKIEPDIIYNIKTKEPLDVTKPATAICAIGQPKQFLKFLTDVNITNISSYNDHYVYTQEDIASIKGNIVTTEKDAVKIQRFGFNNVYALKLKTSFDKKGIVS